jgi:hypothetical protein
LAGDRHEALPPMLRVVLALSIITWMLGGLGAWWFATGALSPRRRVRTGLGIASIAAVSAVVTDPVLLLTLIALILVGYAATVTAQIRKAAAAPSSADS